MPIWFEQVGREGGFRIRNVTTRRKKDMVQHNRVKIMAEYINNRAKANYEKEYLKRKEKAEKFFNAKVKVIKVGEYANNHTDKERDILEGTDDVQQGEQSSDRTKS